MNKAIWAVMIILILLAIQTYASDMVYVVTLKRNNNDILLHGITPDPYPHL